MASNYDPFDVKPVLLLVSAETCPYCPSARVIYQSLSQNEETTKKVELFQINLPSTSSPLDPAIYHEDFIRLIGWFPNFVLVRRSSWRRVVLKPGAPGEIECAIYGGTIENGVPVLTPGRSGITRDVIIKWINDCQASHPFLSDPNLDPTMNPWIQVRKEYLQSIPDAYHVLALSPYWARDTTGRFKSAERKVISSSWLPVLQEKQQRYQTKAVAMEKIKLDTLALGITEYLAVLDMERLCHLLDRTIELLITTHYV